MRLFESKITGDEHTLVKMTVLKERFEEALAMKRKPSLSTEEKQFLEDTVKDVAAAFLGKGIQFTYDLPNGNVPSPEQLEMMQDLIERAVERKRKGRSPIKS